MAATKGQEENPNDRAAKHVNAVQPSERRNDRGVFNSLCSSMGARGSVLCGQQAPGGGQGRAGLPLWVVGSLREGSASAGQSNGHV